MGGRERNDEMKKKDVRMEGRKNQKDERTERKSCGR